LNCQKDSLKGQSKTKSPVKPIWSEKMTVLRTFLESTLISYPITLKTL